MGKGRAVCGVNHDCAEHLHKVGAVLTTVIGGAELAVAGCSPNVWNLWDSVWDYVWDSGTTPSSDSHCHVGSYSLAAIILGFLGCFFGGIGYVGGCCGCCGTDGRTVEAKFYQGLGMCCVLGAFVMDIVGGAEVGADWVEHAQTDEIGRNFAVFAIGGVCVLLCLCKFCGGDGNEFNAHLWGSE
jgi:hypothetical protein